jgi:hypothetical protein
VLFAGVAAACVGFGVAVAVAVGVAVAVAVSFVSVVLVDVAVGVGVDTSYVMGMSSIYELTVASNGSEVTEIPLYAAVTCVIWPSPGTLR